MSNNELTLSYPDEPFYRAAKSLPQRFAHLGMTHAERWVALHLLDLPCDEKDVDEDGDPKLVVWSASSTIAKDLAMGEATVKRALNKFVEKGWLVVEEPPTTTTAARYNYTPLCQAVYRAEDHVPVRRFDVDRGCLVTTPPKDQRKPEPAPKPAARPTTTIPDRQKPTPPAIVAAPQLAPASVELWPCGYCGKKYAHAAQAMECAGAHRGEANAARAVQEAKPEPAPAPVVEEPAAWEPYENPLDWHEAKERRSAENWEMVLKCNAQTLEDDGIDACSTWYPAYLADQGAAS